MNPFWAIEEPSPSTDDNEESPKNKIEFKEKLEPPKPKKVESESKPPPTIGGFVGKNERFLVKSTVVLLDPEDPQNASTGSGASLSDNPKQHYYEKQYRLKAFDVSTTELPRVCLFLSE